MSFFLTVVLTASITLAWFYDSDWANTEVQMAGSVGIEMRNTGKNRTSGHGNFHFKLGNGGPLAYPGQSIDIQANVFNNGGDSVTNWWNNDPASPKTGEDDKPTDEEILASGKGSACYVRARFVVYTDIGKALTLAELKSKYNLLTFDDATSKASEPTAPNFSTATPAQLTEYYNKKNQYNEYLEYEADRVMSSQELYESLVKMITDVNNDSTKSNGYNWVFWENTTPTMTLDGKQYFEGTQQTATGSDGGYFYLCYDSATATGAPTDTVANLTLKPLTVGETAAFLWDGVFVIPWQLTNLSADKTIFVACEFQAIQTFIPLIAGGVIDGRSDNQLKPQFCYYDDISVQTVFNSSRFTNFEQLTTDKNGKVYSKDSSFVKASITTDNTVLNRGTAQANATAKRTS